MQIRELTALSREELIQIINKQQAEVDAIGAGGVSLMGSQPAMPADEVIAYGIIAANTGKFCQVVLASEAHDVAEHNQAFVVPLVARRRIEGEL